MSIAARYTAGGFFLECVMTDLAGKTVWITGASGGIGEALAVSAAQRGARLVLTARREDELRRVQAACGGAEHAAVLPADLLDCDAEALAARAAQCFGPIEVLVNNAGLSQRGTVRDTTMATYRKLFELDFFATVALSKAVLPGMVERRAGHIVVVSSVVGYISSPLRSGYAAAKHALHGFFEALAAEHWREQVHVTLACPGYVRTQVSVNALTGSGQAHGRMDAGQAKGMDPARCAEKIWRAVERERAEVLIGREAAAVYLKRWLPGLYAAILKRVNVG